MAGIISPSFIALSFVLMACVGLMSWAYHYELRGPIMNSITYLCVFIAAAYITASFIIQIPLVNNSNPAWIDWIGLDNFQAENNKFAENISGYAVTVVLYITALIYRKASYRYSQKERYLRQRYPERFIQQRAGPIKVKNFSRKKKASFWDSILEKTKIAAKNPYVHLMVFRFCLFAWIYLYFTFLSLVPMALFWYSFMFQNRQTFISVLKYFFLPLIWLIMIFSYIVNIDKFMTDVFGEDVFDDTTNNRYGIWNHEPAFPHFLFQIFTLFYGCFVCYLFREYDKLQKRLAEIKEKKLRRKQKMEERALQQRERSSSIRSGGVMSSDLGSVYSEMSRPKEEHVFVYEIIIRFILKHIDVLLMIFLYIAGVNRIDVFHMLLLVFFVMFIVYPTFFRKNFIFLMYFMIFFATMKYFYVLFYPEFQANPTADDWFRVLGLYADVHTDRVYGLNDLANNNYLIIITGYIQYCIYTSDFSKAAFSEEQTQKDLKIFAARLPLLTKILTITLEVIIMMIPWVTYIVFLIISVVNKKNLMNLVLLFLNLLLLFWHISADLVTKKSHTRLTRGWKLFTLVAAINFVIIMIFQIASLPEVAALETTQSFIDWLPTIIVKNHDIIGLDSYVEFTQWQLGVKFLAYVAYFNLSVITQRQMERSAKKVKAYEIKGLSPIDPVGSSSSSTESLNEVMKVQFSLVYVVHKLKRFWPVMTTASWHTFTLKAICLVGLAIHWRVTVASAVYILMLGLYYILTPFFLQPNLKSLGIKFRQGVTVEEMKEMWESEDRHAKKRILALRNQFVLFIAFFTIICITIIHLSANFVILADRYPEDRVMWQNITFITWWAGVNWTDQFGGNTFAQEIWGFLFVLALCVIERKGQIWLTNKFGYEGSTYEKFNGIIKIDDYRDDTEMKKKITDIVSAPLESIKEEDEEIRDTLMKKEIEGEGEDGTELKKKKTRGLTPEEKLEKERKKKVEGILRMEYYLFIAKVFRVVIFVAVVLMSLLTSFYKCNIWGAMVLISAAILSFTSVKFRNVKWYTLFMAIILLVQYISVILNVSYETNTSVYPDPFGDVEYPRPIQIPIYRHIGAPITFREIVPSQGLEMPVPDKWAFFLGFIFSRSRFNNLWVDFLILVLTNYFFIYFYSASYELDMSLNTKEAVKRTLDTIDQENSENSKRSTGKQNREENKEDDSKAFSEIISANPKKTTYYEAQRYIDQVKDSMMLVKFYNGLSTAVCATSSIISLICLLIIAFQIEGFINLFYIIFCLWYLARAVNFVFQKNWTFPIYLKSLLKGVVLLELLLQFGFQAPLEVLHPEQFKNPDEVSGVRWQRIIGLVSVWRVSPVTGLPENTDIVNLVLKCLMFAFIISQENIFLSEEYEYFIKKTLAGIRSFSDRKTESMAYLYNNQKLKTTVQNQFEKDTMMKKLVMVNRQVKKWNATVFSKSTDKKELEEETRKQLAPKEETKDEKIHEVDEHLEEEKHETNQDGELSRSQTMMVKEAEKQIEEAKERDKAIEREKKREDMRKPELIKDLIDEKLHIGWKILIYLTGKCTNQILLVFSFSKLNEIFEEVRTGETHIYTDIEEKLYDDYIKNIKKRDELELDTILDLEEEEKSMQAEKGSGIMKLILNIYFLMVNTLLSNTEFLCYLFMVICMIMNGSLLSLVYPVSIFIYALLEEKRPGKGYWLIMLNFTAAVLILKFLFQTYPFSQWITSNFTPEDVTTDDSTPNINSVNDYFRALRIGLENVEDSGRNFIKFFVFESLILLTVTLHILILVFGGVWSQRELEAESIDAAANRISTFMTQERAKKLAREKKNENLDKTDSFLTEEIMESFLRSNANDVRPPGYERMTRRRAFSLNDCTRLTEVAHQINETQNIDPEIFEDRLEEWRDIEREFAYGGTKFEDEYQLDVKDKLIKDMKRLTHSEYLDEYKRDLIHIRNNYVTRKQSPILMSILNTTERAMTQYNFQELDIGELKNFVIENKAGESKLAQIWMKIKFALTQSKYFESLFPTIKEQKPGVDLYAPMVVFQVLVIVFMIFFYTTMDPDFTNITSSELTPTTFNATMVLAVFIQICIIVLDRYLYLSRDYVVIDEVEVEDYGEDDSDGEIGRSDSISQFDRSNSFDLRSSSANKLMFKGIGKKEVKLKGKGAEAKNLDEEAEMEAPDPQAGIQLSKTKFNKTLLLKYYLQLFLLILIHVLVFWVWPIKANVDLMATPFCQFTGDQGDKCNEVFMNWTLVVFYLLYCGYFFVSALQIRYGLPELRKGNFAMEGYSAINKGIFMGFMSTPFVFELKIITDWTFTRTALDLFQWIKFESVYGDLFVAKCTNKPIYAHPLGQKIAWFMKLGMG